MPNHYVALLHSNITLADGVSEGNSSVTSIDIHDLARSTKTFGIHHYFVVTELVDQQKIVNRLLDFWQEGPGVTYREQRHEALQSVTCVASLQSVIEAIEQQEKKRPIIIATSAKDVAQDKNITYYDQERVWASQRPVLILFGTANGLGASVLDQCDYVLVPIEGFSSYNHLSVRSAAAIVLDRWLGINIKHYYKNV
jgi:tRNA (guanine37-N1)-methyltransferase